MCVQLSRMCYKGSKEMQTCCSNVHPGHLLLTVLLTTIQLQIMSCSSIIASSDDNGERTY